MFCTNIKTDKSRNYNVFKILTNIFIRMLCCSINRVFFGENCEYFVTLVSNGTAQTLARLCFSMKHITQHVERKKPLNFAFNRALNCVGKSIVNRLCCKNVYAGILFWDYSSNNSIDYDSFIKYLYNF